MNPLGLYTRRHPSKVGGAGLFDILLVTTTSPNKDVFVSIKKDKYVYSDAVEPEQWALYSLLEKLNSEPSSDLHILQVRDVMRDGYGVYVNLTYNYKSPSAVYYGTVFTYNEIINAEMSTELVNPVNLGYIKKAKLITSGNSLLTVNSQICKVVTYQTGHTIKLEDVKKWTKQLL